MLIIKIITKKKHSKNNENLLCANDYCQCLKCKGKLHAFKSVFNKGQMCFQCAVQCTTAEMVPITKKKDLFIKG